MSAIPNPFGAGENRRLESHPRITPRTTSPCHKIVHGHVKAYPAKTWDMWFDAQPDKGIPALKNPVQFPDDDTVINLFVEQSGLVFPEPAYECKGAWLVTWRKVGTRNVCSEITIVEEPMATATPAEPAAAAPAGELTAAFPRDDAGTPVEQASAAWGDDPKARNKFFGKYNRICDDHAVPQTEREPIRKRVLKEKYGVDSLKGFDKSEDVLLTVLAEEIEPLYPLAMAGKPAARENGQGAAQAATPAIGIPETQGNATAGKSEPQSGQDLPPIPKPEYCGIKTFTGIPIEEVAVRSNARYDLRAYGKVEYKPQWTDLDPVYIRRRLEELFGPHGFGWSIIPHPAMGKHFFEEIAGSKKPYRVVYEMYILRYRIKLPDGSWDFVDTSPQSDSFSGTDRDEAYKSAFTSIMKTLLRSIGGIDHLLLDEYGHEEAKRDMNRKAS